MTLKEIIDKCEGLEVARELSISCEYDEFVFLSKEMDKWSKVFEDILGPAVKPAGVKPTADQLMLSKEYGGVYENQTLFKKDFDDVSIIAMFWPWQDKTHTTLKLALLKKD